MTAEEAFGKYRVQFVHRRITPDQQREVVEFWRRHRALPPSEDGVERSRRVFYLTRNPAQEVVGVCSVFVADFHDKGPHYFYRTFIQPSDRRTGLADFMWRHASLRLIATYTTDKPRGIVMVVDNPALWNDEIRKRFEWLAYRKVDKDSRGVETWLRSLP